MWVGGSAGVGSWWSICCLACTASPLTGGYVAAHPLAQLPVLCEVIEASYDGLSMLGSPAHNQLCTPISQLWRATLPQWDTGLF